MCGGGAECEIREVKGVIAVNGEGGKEGVRKVKRSGGEKDFEGWGGCCDKGDGVDFVKAVITVFWLYSKPWVGPRGKGGVWGK